MKTIVLLLALTVAMFAQAVGSASNWQPTKQEVQVVSLNGTKVIQTQNTIFVDVTFEELKLKTPPKIFTALQGEKNHWEAIGVTSIYYLTEKGFRVYLHYRDGITPEMAKQWKWELIYWIVK